MASHPRSEDFTSATRVVLVADLAGYAAAFSTRSDEDIVRLLGRYYGLAEEVIAEGGGRVVKFMGDAVLAVFVSSDVASAVRAAGSLESGVRRLSLDVGLSIELGVNVHMGSVIEAELGSGAGRRPDVFGRTVNQAFLLGSGPGIRLSEAVHRELPVSERVPWTASGSPAVYTLD